jgi:hypothetical protein
MKNVMVMLAVAMIPATAGCNCCGLGACPCNPCNWFNRGAYCGPTTYATPVVAAPTCPPTVSPAVLPPTMPQQYVMPNVAPYATPYSAAPAMAAPAQMPYAYTEPGCAYAAEPSCGYMGMVGYGRSMPMEMGGVPMQMGGCCEMGSYDAGAVGTPTESFVTPEPAAE